MEKEKIAEYAPQCSCLDPMACAKDAELPAASHRRAASSEFREGRFSKKKKSSEKGGDGK
jgi:hypothetical protein